MEAASSWPSPAHQRTLLLRTARLAHDVGYLAIASSLFTLIVTLVEGITQIP
jgi:hypothetical protein